MNLFHKYGGTEFKHMETIISTLVEYQFTKRYLEHNLHVILCVNDIKYFIVQLMYSIM